MEPYDTIVRNFVTNFVRQWQADETKKAGITDEYEWVLMVSQLNAMNEAGVLPDTYTPNALSSVVSSTFFNLGYPQFNDYIAWGIDDGTFDSWPIPTTVPVDPS